MNVQSIRRPIVELQTQWLALGVFDDASEPPAAVKGTPLGDLVARLNAAKELPGGPGETVPLHGPRDGASDGVLLFGLGPRDRFDPGAAFAAGVAVSKRLASKARGTVSVVLPESQNPSAVASALVEGLVVGTRGPGLRKSEPARHSF